MWAQPAKVIPMKSPLCYVGGKSRLCKTIIPEFPEHTTYGEVFAGACWVLFAKEPSKYEIINDVNGDLVAFWRVVQNHLEEFFKQFKFLLVSHELFDDWQRQAEAGGLTDIQRAARYYYLQRCGYGGRVVRRTWGGGPLRPPRVNLLRLEEELSQVHLRLAGVTIEHMTWFDFLQRYDRPSTLFYLDPPYWGCEDYYGNAFTRSDFALLADALAGIASKFTMSINDVPEIRQIFAAFNIKQVSTSYSLASQKVSKVQELLISNY